MRIKQASVVAMVLLAQTCARATTGSPSTVSDQEDATPASLPADSTAPTSSIHRQASGGVFSEQTGAFLLFDDGIDGVLGVDLDDRVAARRVLEGQRAGDAMNRLVRVDDTLVVGWASIHALSLDTLKPRALGEATVFIPAAECDRVWLIDYPGGRIGQGTPTYQQVSVDGNEITVSRGLDPSEALPALGIPGGIVHETDSGIDIWEAESQEVTRVAGAGVGFVADVHQGLIAWCDGECVLHLTEVGELDIVVPSPDQSRHFDPRSARFSPDGRLLAAIVGDPGGSQAAIAVVEVESGVANLITEPLMPRPSYVAWSDDGDSLFFSSWSYQEDETLLGWYRPHDGHLEVTTLPFGGAFSFLVLEVDDAGQFLPEKIGSQDTCPQVSTYPSGRTGICGFNFESQTSPDGS